MSGNDAAYEHVTECDMDFYYAFTVEAYDLVNLIPYFTFYTFYQFIGLWGIVFDKAISLAQIFKFSYLGFQHIYSAEGLLLFKK